MFASARVLRSFTRRSRVCFRVAGIITVIGVVVLVVVGIGIKFTETQSVRLSDRTHTCRREAIYVRACRKGGFYTERG